MRILLTSDLHYTLPQLDWVVRVAPTYDLVVLAGDHLDISSPVSLDAQSIVILRYLALLPAAGHVAACSGNHDLTVPDEQGEQCALGLDLPLAAPGLARLLDGQAQLWRHRTRWLDRAAPAGHRAHRPRARAALQARGPLG